MIKKLVTAGAAGLFIISALVLGVSAPTYAQAVVDETDKITICHRDNNTKKPYREIEVAPSAVDGEGNGDHYLEHQGPLAYSEEYAEELKDQKIEWGDIIPPVPGYHSGLNWTTKGQAIYNNDCDFESDGGDFYVADASVTVIPATCEAPAKLQYNVETDVENAHFTEESTASGTVGPANYTVEAVAEIYARFPDGAAGVSDDRTTKTWTGSLSATLTGADCVLGETPVTPVTPGSGAAAPVSTPEVLPETGAASPATITTILAAITGVLTVLGFGIRTALAHRL